MKKSVKIILISFATVATVPLVICVAFIIFYFQFLISMTSLYPSVEVPTIRNAEFPFEITYEKNGEVFNVKDVYVCEYDGIVTTWGGKFLCWDEYIKSNNKQALTLFEDDETEIVLSVGAAWYYMKDPYRYSVDDENKPMVCKRTRYGSGNAIYPSDISDEELYSEYGIKIIDWKLSDPIENTYVQKKWYEFWK